MKFNHISILLVFTFLSIQTIQGQDIDSLLQNKIKTEKAISSFDPYQLLNENPDTISLSKGDKYLIAGDYGKAYNQFKEDLEDDKLNHDLYYKKGVAAIYSIKYSSALKNFNKAIELSPDNFLYYYGRGVLRMKKHEQLIALDDFQKVVELNSSHKNSYKYLAEINCGLRRFDDALAYSKIAIELMPNTASLHCRRAIIYLHLNNKEAAIKDLKITKELDPSYNDYANYLLQCSLDEIRDSGASYYSTVKAKSGSAAYFTNRGDLKRDAYRFKDAITDYEKAIAVDSMYSKAYNGMGLANAFLNNYSIAISHLEKAIELDKEPAKIYYNLARVYFSTEQYFKAVQELDQAISLETHFPSAYFYRGMAKEKLGMLVEAEQDLDEALKQKPYSTTMQKALKQIRKKLKKK